MTDLSREDIEFIKELREKHQSGKVSRREALAGLGAVGVGAAGGFFGAGTASADDHTDNEGNVGLPADPVDGWFDSINPPGGSGSGNSTSLDAAEISSFVNQNKISLRTGSGVTQTSYELSTTGFRNAVSDAPKGSIITVPPAVIDLGTTGETLPDNTSLICAGKRATQFTVSDGVGDAISPGNNAYIRGFTVLGDSGGTADDTGIEVGSSDFVRGQHLEVQNMWKSVHIGSGFNNRFDQCYLSNSRTGQTQGASVHIEGTSGADENVFSFCYFGNCGTRVIWDNVGTTQIHGAQIEGGTGDRIIYKSGEPDSYYHAMLYQVEPTTAGVDLQVGTATAVLPILDAGSGVGGSVPPVREQGAPGMNIQTGRVTGWGTGMPGFSTGTEVNGMATENANAEEPQETYIPGKFVDFTDTGDGSGDGVYIIDRSGSPVGQI